MNTYKEYYQENVVPALMERFSYKSNMQAPRLVKITLNMGLGSAISDKKILEKAQEELTQISGQKAKQVLLDFSDLSRSSLTSLEILEKAVWGI